MRLATAGLMVSVIVACLPFGGAADARSAVPRPHVTAPGSAVEGDTFAITARFAKGKDVQKVELQSRDQPQYAGWALTPWVTLRSVRPHGHSTIKVTARATTEREDWYRVIVTYKNSRRQVTSPAARVNIYHWIPRLTGAYFTSGSSIDNLGFSMAGLSWQGWELWGTTAAESRYSLVSGCIEFKGTVGLGDGSADGSTGSIALSTIDSTDTAATVYTSPTLTPGRTYDVTLPLNSPYRFAVVGKNTSTPVTTSAGTTTPKAQAALGNPRFLCHQD